MTVQIENTKSNFAIFLDIDGVFNYDGISPQDIDVIIKNTDDEEAHTSKCERCIKCDTAAAHLFEKSAVACFDELILKMNTLVNVHIIISSAWRCGRTVDELKRIFHMHSFSQYIVDKTVEHGNKFETWKDHCMKPHFDINNIPSEIFAKLHRDPNSINKLADLGARCRASQIKQWIYDHPGYIGHVIFDDIDDHLSENFPIKFISTRVNNTCLLKRENTEKAYDVFQQFLQDSRKSNTI